MDPSQKFNALYSVFLEWKNEPKETRGNWFARKALYYRKNRHLITRRRKSNHRPANV